MPRAFFLLDEASQIKEDVLRRQLEVRTVRDFYEVLTLPDSHFFLRGMPELVYQQLKHEIYKIFERYHDAGRVVLIYAGSLPEKNGLGRHPVEFAIVKYPFVKYRATIVNPQDREVYIASSPSLQPTLVSRAVDLVF